MHSNPGLTGPGSLVPHAGEGCRLSLLPISLAACLAAMSASAHELPLPAQPLPASATTTLYLDVMLNGYPTQWIVPFRHTPDGHFWIERHELDTLGLRAPEEAAVHEGWVDLSALPGLQAQYDEARQTLNISAIDAALTTRIINAKDQSFDANADYISASARDIGAYLNHSLSYTTGGEGGSGWRRFQGASGFFDAHVYSPLGVVSSAHLLRRGRTDAGYRQTRLETQWEYFDQQRLITYSAGDIVGSSLSWSRSARLGGVQMRRNFAIRPDLITMPLMEDFTGSAAVPSTVEVYINNVQQLSRPLTPGPFAITNLPLITGGGTARLVVRDATGREVLSETPFYASSDMLGKGLADFSLEIGVPRHSYGMESQQYGSRVLGAGTLRYGLNNALTLEAHGEGGARFQQAGLGGLLRVGTLGVVSASAAGSQYRADEFSPARRERGQQYALGLQTQHHLVSVYVNTQWTHGDFNDLASITLPPGMPPAERRSLRPSRRMSQVSVSLPLGGGTSASFAYTQMQPEMGVRTRLASAMSSFRLGRRGALSLSLFKDLQRADSLSAFLSLSIFFDNRLSASGSLDYSGHQTTRRVDLSQAAHDRFGDTGWRIRASRGRSEMAGAEASYRSRVGLMDGGIERYSGGSGGTHSVNARVQFDGALVVAGGGVFFANRIDNAFAIVDAGTADVPVQYENRPIGLTNARGQLLLTGLNAFEQNLISIDPMALPVDARVEATRLLVKPNWRSGLRADFKVQLNPRTALIALVDEDGQAIAVGAGARLNGGGEVFVVGYDGKVYLEGIERQNTLNVQRAGEKDCEFIFSAQDTLRERLVIRDAVCRGVR